MNRYNPHSTRSDRNDRNDHTDRRDRTNYGDRGDSKQERNKTEHTQQNYHKTNLDNESEQKQQIINYIYSVIEVSRYKYKVLEVEDDLQLLDVNKYVVSANFTGPNCLLVFIKIKDKFYSHLIDRKTLSYNPSQIKLDNLKTTRVRVALDQSIYDGSIFDGILLQQGSSRTFVITDCYYFRGKNLSDDQLVYKLINVKSYLEANYKSDNIINTLKLSVNKIYELSDISTLITNDIPKTKNINIRGITFHPIISGTKLIYLFGNEAKTTNNTFQLNQKQYHVPINSVGKQSANSGTDQQETHPKHKTTVTYVCKTDQPIFATLEIRKTETVDVYKLYSVEKCTKNNKTVLKSKKMGIAYIPTEKCSRTCKNLISSDNSRILMKCQFIQDKNKWMPIEQDSISKIPTFITDIEKNMDIIEDTCSDSE